MHIETQCLHEGYKPKNGEPKALPIYQSTNVHLRFHGPHRPGCST